MCFIFTSKFNFSGFTHRNFREVYAMWCSCAYQNLHCIKEMRINILAQCASWQSISCSLHASEGLKLRKNCWDHKLSRKRLAVKHPFFCLDVSCQSHLPCGTSIQVFNVNQKHTEVILLLIFHQRTEWPQIIYCAWLKVEGQEIFG